MTFTLTNLEAITLFVEDLTASRAFYRNVFGLTVLFEDDVSTAFGFGNTVINLLLATESAELITPAVAGGPDTGPRSQLTIPVADADEVCAELLARGVVLLNGPQDRPWGVRTAAFRDPAGHVWEIAQPLKPAAA